MSSWFTDIAGKAEGLLNQLDQSAATALQKPPGSSRINSKSSLSGLPVDQGNAAFSGVISHDGRSSGSNFKFNSNYDIDKREKKSSGYASSVSSFPIKKSQQTIMKMEDEKLIDYLNESAESASLSNQKMGISSSNRSGRSSATSSVRSAPAYRPSSVSTPSGPAIDSSSNTLIFNPVVVPNEKPTSTSVSFETKDIDYQKTIQAKDSQLAILRVRLQDADHQLQIKAQKMHQLEEQHERWLKTSLDSTGNSTQTLENLEKQLKETEFELDRERTVCKRLENEFLARIQRLENEQSDVLQQLTVTQKLLTEEKIKCNEYTEQLKLAKYNLESNKLEFDEYKQKATRILQSKEKLINTLKNEDPSSPARTENNNLLIQLEEMKTERDLAKEDLQQAHMQLYNLRADVQELESQLATEQRSALEHQRQLQDQCQTFQQSAAQYREQYEQLKQDYQYVQDEMRRQHVMFQNKLKEKDAEITRLINQITLRPQRNSDESELEIRIRQLTENLIQKQTVIEALQTDKQTLSLHLERAEKMYREAETAIVRASSTVIDINGHEEGIHSRITGYLRETPYDTAVTRSVKKAYSSIEKFSVRFGVFLRRFPLARVFLLIYAMLLHLWVAVVLLTYTPEMHPAEYKPAGRLD